MRSFYRLCEKAEIPRTNVHAMRHTFATRMPEAGQSVKVVQELFGHSSITQTLNVYTHVLESTKKEAINKTNHLFEVK
jgi:site-specific recombinase XerD